MEGQPITIIGKGTRKQNYINTKDVALAVQLAIESNVQGIFNIASSDSISNIELAKLCKTFLDSKSSIKLEGEDKEEGINWDISIDKAYRELHYLPQKSILKTIREIADSYENTNL